MSKYKEKVKLRRVRGGRRWVLFDNELAARVLPESPEPADSMRPIWMPRHVSSRLGFGQLPQPSLSFLANVKLWFAPWTLFLAKDFSDNLCLLIV